MLTYSYRGSWQAAMETAHAFVTNSPRTVTLRQVFYHLVAKQLIENTENNYKGLSARTAKERRAGTFPALIDNNREIRKAYADKSPKQALLSTAFTYRMDRTIGQKYQIWVLAEKRGMAQALVESFEQYGANILGLGGYASQTILDDVVAQVEKDGRPAIGIYAGDFDATGQDIPRNFQEGTNCWHEWLQVALTDQQIDEYQLPENPGKETDSRSKAFAERNGRSVQVEVDALDPEVLDGLYREAFFTFYDLSAFQEIPDLEEEHREKMFAFIDGWEQFEVSV